MNGILTQAQGDLLMSQGNEDARGQAVNAGILGAAEGILTAPDLMTALGKGFGGYNRGYNTSLVANRPKVTPLADGAFSQVTMPDGSTKIVGNQQVADFLKNKWQLQNQMKQDNIILGGQVGAQRTGAASDIKQGGEAETALSGTEMSIEAFTKGLDIVKAQSAPDGTAFTIPFTNIKITKAQLQGMAPTMAGLFGGDQVAANKFLQGLKVDDTLLKTANTKGAISNEEMRLFASPIPALTDDREKVWKPYLEQRLPVLKKIRDFQAKQAQQGQAAASGATITGRPGAAPTAPAAPRFSTGDPDIDQFLN